MKKSHVSRSLTTKSVFKRSALAAMVMAVTSTAMAQEVEEEVLVTGIRANLQSAADMKRDASNHIDAISADDIGSLPDVSVLEAVQRIPGISIERFAAADDPDHYSVEGSGALLRGLPQTLSQFNGRDSFSANSGRGLSFQDVSPELMGSVEVIKSQSADLIEGGISGTINLNTRKPFDQEGQKFAFNIQGNYSDMRMDSLTEMTPTLSGLYSNRWETGIGEFGFLISHADATIKNRSDGLEAGVWREYEIPELGTRWAPINGGIRRQDTDRNRQGSSLVFQYADPSGVTETTFEYFRQKATQDWTEKALYEDNQQGTPSADSRFDDVKFLRGTMENVERMQAQVRRKNLNTQVEDFSLNVKIRPLDNLSLSVDAQYIDAVTTDVDLSSYAMPLVADVYLDFTTAEEVPNMQIRAKGAGDDEAQSVAYFQNQDNYLHLAAMDHLEDSEGKESAIRLDGEYTFDMTFLSSIEAGVRYAKREQTSRWANYNWNPTGAPWVTPHVWLDGTEDSNWSWSGNEVKEGTVNKAFGPNEQHFFDNFHEGKAGNVLPGQYFWGPRSSTVADYTSWLYWTNTFKSDHQSLGDRDGVIPGTVYLPVEINDVTEESQAAYVKFNFSVANELLTGDIGFRYVSRENSTAGGEIYRKDDTMKRYPHIFSSDELAFSNDATRAGRTGATFSDVLPSLNLRYELSDAMFLRFAASKAVSFPELGLLRYNYPVELDNIQVCFDPSQAVDENGDGCHSKLNDGVETPTAVSQQNSGYKADAGNPFLNPMESNNFDFSWEWYFGQGNQLAAGVFHKNITNFFATGRTPTEFTNNGVKQVVDVNGPINSGDGKINGFEFSYQQFFDMLPSGWDGLGMQYNFTYLKNEGSPNQNTRSVQVDEDGRTEPPFEDLPLQSLSNRTFNLIGMYDYGPLNLRLAINKRSKYLLTQSQANLKLPIYSEPTMNVDFSFGYRITDNWEAGFQIANLTNEVTKTTVQVNQEQLTLPRTYFVSDRRYTFQIKGNF